MGAQGGAGMGPGWEVASCVSGRMVTHEAAAGGGGASAWRSRQCCLVWPEEVIQEASYCTSSRGRADARSEAAGAASAAVMV